MKLFVKSTLYMLAAALLVINSGYTDNHKDVYKVGDKVKAFTLKDAQGKEHDLSKVFGDKIVVLDFWSLKCPVSKAYEERLKAIHKKFKGKDVAVYAIDSNHNNSIDEIKEYAKKHELTYPVLKDWNNKIADKFGARTTPEVFVICKGEMIQYHGAIDNNQNPEKVEHSYLENALTSMIAGNPIDPKKTKSFGCSIKRES